MAAGPCPSTTHTMEVAVLVGSCAASVNTAPSSGPSAATTWAADSGTAMGAPTWSGPLVGRVGAGAGTVGVDTVTEGRAVDEVDDEADGLGGVDEQAARVRPPAPGPSSVSTLAGGRVRRTRSVWRAALRRPGPGSFLTVRQVPTTIDPHA